MEPMALGSPVGSPANPGATSPYLPQYLLGENEVNSQSLNQSLGQSHPGSTTVRQLMSPTSPNRGKHVSFTSPTLSSFGTPLGSADARMNRGPGTPGLITHQSEKGSGPPTTGLFDTLRPAAQPSQLFSPPRTQDTSVFEANLNASLLASSPPSSSQPRWSNNEPLTSNWVTVFGFPTSATSSILAQFARYGNVIDKQLPVQGNWMHLQYQTRIEVRRAVGNNGKIFGGNTMIGVMPCTDPAIVGESCKENVGVVARDPNISRLSMATAGNTSFGTPGMSSPGPFVSPVCTPHGPHTARPLQRAFSTTHIGSDVVSPQHTPQRSTSFVSRAMDYVFNW